MKRISRRSFLHRTLPAAAAGAFAACAAPSSDEGKAPAVHTRDRISWRLVSSFPRGLDTIFGASEVLAERLDTATQGRFKVRVYPAGELVPALQVMDAVQQGTVQVAQTASYYFTGKNPALAFDTGLPFGLTSRQQTAWLTQAGGLELVQQLYADFGIISFPGGNTGAQMGGWFRREVETPADLVGLKMRIPGVGGAVMDRLGVTVQVLPGGDIYTALERGAIDATEWVGPYDDEKLGFHKVTKLCYYPGWWEPGPSLSFLVQRPAWDALSLADQALFRAACSEAAITMQARYDAQNPPAFERLKSAGVAFRQFSRPIMEASAVASEELLQEQAAADATYRGIYEQWWAFRRSSFRFFSTAENSYAEFAFPRA